MNPHSSPHLPSRFRTVSKLLLLALVVLGAAVAGGGRVARADGGLVNIDGKPVSLERRYFDGDTRKMVEKSIPTQVLDQFVPMKDQPCLTEPLNQQLDDAWQGKTSCNGDQNANARQQQCDWGQQTINNLASNNGGFSVSNISCALAHTGSLSAKVDSFGSGFTPVLTLDYRLSKNSVSFDAAPIPCGGGLVAVFTLGLSCVVSWTLQGTYTISGDIDLLITTPVPSTGCQLNPGVQVILSNTSVTGDDAGAAFAGLFNDQLQQYLNSSGAAVPSISTATFQTLAGDLENACKSAVNDDLDVFDAKVDPVTSPSGLVFRLTDLEDAAPTPINASAPDPSLPDLTPATIGVSEPEVKAGGRLTVTGSLFAVPQSTAITIDWDDTFDDTFTESDIQWGPKGGPLQPLVTIARDPTHIDGKNTWQATGLKPDANYQFQVRDCYPVTYPDPLTGGTITLFTICTPYNSDPLYARTAASGSDAVNLYLDKVDAAGELGSGTVQPDGTFSSPVTIPAGTTAAVHTLYAQEPASGRQASVSITVAGATASLTPTIEVIDPSTNAVAPYAGQGGSFTLRGDGFAAGTVTVTLGTAGGQKLGTVTVKADGTFKKDFTLPMSVYGNTTVVAGEDDGGQTLQATTSVAVLAAPR